MGRSLGALVVVVGLGMGCSKSEPSGAKAAASGRCAGVAEVIFGVLMVQGEQDGKAGEVARLNDRMAKFLDKTTALCATDAWPEASLACFEALPRPADDLGACLDGLPGPAREHLAGAFELLDDH